MSHRIKNVTLEDGFARNPNRIYHEEFFNTLPHQHKEFSLPSSSGDTDFTIYQPANTFLKEMYVVCTTAPILSTAGECRNECFTWKHRCRSNIWNCSSWNNYKYD